MSHPDALLRWPAMSAAPSRPGWNRPGWGWPEALAVTVAGALIFAAVFFGGASGDGSVLWVGGAAVVAAAVALGAASLGLWPLPRLDRPARAAVAGLVALVVWTGASIVWSIAGDESWSALNKGMAYVGFLLVGVTLAALGTNTTRTVASLLAGVLAAALVWALAGKAIPALAAGDASRVARLHSPVGYWNGLALLADAALVLGLWIVAALAGDRLLRAAGGALVYLAVLTGLLTGSRAGVLAGLLVVGFWLWLGAGRVDSAASAVAAGVPAALAAGWAFTRPALADPGHTHADRVHDGAVFGVLALAGLAVAVAAVLLVPRLVTGRERATVRVLVIGAVAAVALGLVAVAVTSGNPFTKAAHGFSRSECTNTASRFGCTNNNRLRWWGEALDVFRDRPLGGAGAFAEVTAQVARESDAGFERFLHDLTRALSVRRSN